MKDILIKFFKKLPLKISNNELTEKQLEICFRFFLHINFDELLKIKKDNLMDCFTIGWYINMINSYPILQTTLIDVEDENLVD